MSEKEIMLSNAEAVLNMEERLLSSKFEGIKLKRSLLNLARDSPLHECTELIGKMWPKLDEPPTPARAADAKPLDERPLQAARDKLYDALPPGEVDAFTLMKIIQTHIKDLDKILEVS